MIEVLKISLIGFMFSALTQDQHTLLSWYGKLVERLPWYFYKPLGGCYRCFVGQLCLWYFIITKPFNLIELGFFVSAGIMLSMIYNAIYCYLK
jgi:hypothetical protein